jgi:hypothetical protein
MSREYVSFLLITLRKNNLLGQAQGIFSAISDAGDNLKLSTRHLKPSMAPILMTTNRFQGVS